MRIVLPVAALLFGLAHGSYGAEPVRPGPGCLGQVITPPESLKVNPFYKKYLNCEGLPILASEKAREAALCRACELAGKMLAERSDIREALIEADVRFVVIGAEEGVTEIPEYSHMKPKAFWDERSRGFGGRIVSCGEENLLCYPVDRYDDESIFIHEFAHCIDGYGLRRIDEKFNEGLKELYEKAIGKGLWKYTYAASNPGEYWAEGVQSWFECNRQNNYNHNHVNTREELKAYDPDLAKLIAEVFRLTEKTDWRYEPIAKQPQVTAVPESLECDPFYKKYVRARGLAVLASEKVCDEALLEANYLIRQMFAYRHDILKAIIEANVRFVVIGVDEKITDIPEYGDLKRKQWWNKQRRSPGYSRQRPVISCTEENLLNYPDDAHAGENILIRQFALALHKITGLREIDEDFDSRPKQQYELHVKRMDKEFDGRLAELFESAKKNGLWQVTSAGKNRSEYWAEGVQSWLDANREGGRRHNDVNTREELEAYDPDLAKLVAEVFRHDERVDWRYRQRGEREKD
ncbi:MAG: hypothetical protein ISS79_07745 [Phycisphaerae bacterium]|nr:hypothetical protein [Phycisphaerae bacterium]